MTDKPILEAIRQLLSDAKIEFREVHHEPTFTSEDSARARGEDLKIGGKALLMKLRQGFTLFVLPADRKIDSSAVRKSFGSKKMRFATKEELLELTGLVPGCVPPFGEPILPFELHVDQAISDNERIAFNAGSLTDSIIMSVDDYLKIAHPTSVGEFSIETDTQDRS